MLRSQTSASLSIRDWHRVIYFFFAIGRPPIAPPRRRFRTLTLIFKPKSHYLLYFHANSWHRKRHGEEATHNRFFFFRATVLLPPPLARRQFPEQGIDAKLHSAEVNLGASQCACQIYAKFYARFPLFVAISSLERR